MGMIGLPEPPPDAGPNCLAFYSELRRMLNEVRPSKVSRSKIFVEFSNHDLEIYLVHTDNDDWTVGVTMDETQGIVFVDLAHEHFSAADSGSSVRPWTTQMVDFVAEALRGEIATRTVFRGSSPISVEHFRVEADGSSTSLWFTGYLTPRRAMFWLPKTSTTERHSFV